MGGKKSKHQQLDQPPPAGKPEPENEMKTTTDDYAKRKITTCRRNVNN